MYKFVGLIVWITLSMVCNTVSFAALLEAGAAKWVMFSSGTILGAIEMSIALIVFLGYGPKAGKD